MTVVQFFVSLKKQRVVDNNKEGMDSFVCNSNQKFILMQTNLFIVTAYTGTWMMYGLYKLRLLINGLKTCSYLMKKNPQLNY